MDWHPLRLTTPVKQHVFGGRAIAEQLGRTGLPDGPVAETWEVSDVEGDASTVLDGPLAQTSDIQQHAMRRCMEDGSPVPDHEWHAGLDRLLDEWRPGHRPEFHPGLSVRQGDDVVRTVLCAGPHFALERWCAGTAAPWFYRWLRARPGARHPRPPPGRRPRTGRGRRPR
ncbi:hypothetical protein [Streptomyces tibetensis]|uniref:hypothetical protein n=1 Tax=Streptomyces tibetensis TaxID=2382123 RepID=UPI003406A89E